MNRGFVKKGEKSGSEWNCILTHVWTRAHLLLCQQTPADSRGQDQQRLADVRRDLNGLSHQTIDTDTTSAADFFFIFTQRFFYSNF